MMASEHIVDVSEADFQTEVILYSNTVPVVVDVWAEWCQPCMMLSPMLEKLARQANGTFRLAKVNADENRNLVIQLNIHSLPAVKGFSNGQIVAEFNGVQPENKVRDFLRSLSASPGSLAQEKGYSLLRLGRWQDAAEAFNEALKSDPDDSLALLGLAKSLLARGVVGNALAILREFPASKHYPAAERLLPLAEAMAWQQSQPEQAVGDELGSAYYHSLRLVSLGNLEAATDGLLDILKQDKNYRQGEAHRVVLGIIELMEEEEISRKYRNELAGALF